MTIVAECKYALTGVGAAIAPGNQAWNGYCADFVNAPISKSTSATVITVPVGRGPAASWLSRDAPVSVLMSTNPASIASPPALVTSSACNAAARALGSVCWIPIRRNDVIDVSSQNVYRMKKLSDWTRPTIAPPNKTSTPDSRPTLGVSSAK